MRLKILCEVLVLIVVAFAASEVTRDKRTIDVVLRSVADAFGYDIQKRPAILPPAATTPAPIVSTFFPPPVAPLPRPARYPLAPRASLPPPKAAPLPAPVPKLPPPPPPPPPPKLPPRRASPPKPPLPPPPPAPKAPPSPPPPAPKRPAPLLTESVKKTFNLNFNWNKNVQPGAPAPPAKPPAVPAQVPAKPPIAPPPPAPATPAPAAPVPRRNPGGQVYIHKPQLYQEYDYLNTNSNQNEPTPQTLREDFEQQLQEQELNDYPEYQNQYLSQDYSESNKEYATKPTDNDHKHAKEKFKETVNAFWKAYPLTDQHGYKYIALQKPTEQKAQFSQTFPNDFSKYEEYDLKPVNKNIAQQQQQQHNCPPQQTHLAKVQYPKNTEVIYHQPKKAKVQYPKNSEVVYHQPKYPKNTEVTYHESKNTKVQYPKNTEVIYHQNPKHTESETHSAPKDTEVIYDQLKDTEGVTYEDISPDYETHEVYLVPKDYLDYYTDEPAQPQQEETAQYANSARQPVGQRRTVSQQTNETNHSAETVAHPLYSGILPAQLHHLARSESQSKPYSVPYDYDIESTENKNKFVKKSPTKAKVDDAYQYECCEKQIASHNFDFYTVPEPERVDLSKYEKLHTDDDEDDGKLSRNAKIQTKEKKVSVIKTNKYENPVKY